MYAKTKSMWLSCTPAARSVLLLLAWLPLSDAVVGQVVDEENAVAVRTSVKGSEQQKRPDLAEVAKLVVQKTDAFRQEQKLGKVATNSKLVAAAADFAEYMAETNRYGHTADGKRPWERAKNHGYDYCLVSENIAYEYHSLGFATEELAGELFQGWKDSPEHRKNMLDAAVTETGVAVAQSQDTGYFYAVQMFGRPKSQSIRFEIENHSSSAIEYELGNQKFPLPPSYTRTHTHCRPAQLTFRWPAGAKSQPQTVQASDGDRLVITEEAGQWEASLSASSAVKK